MGIKKRRPKIPGEGESPGLLGGCLNVDGMPRYRILSARKRGMTGPRNFKNQYLSFSIDTSCSEEIALLLASPEFTGLNGPCG